MHADRPVKYDALGDLARDRKRPHVRRRPAPDGHVGCGEGQLDRTAGDCERADNIPVCCRPYGRALIVFKAGHSGPRRAEGNLARGIENRAHFEPLEEANGLAVDQPLHRHVRVVHTVDGDRLDRAVRAPAHESGNFLLANEDPDRHGPVVADQVVAAGVHFLLGPLKPGIGNVGDEVRSKQAHGLALIGLRQIRERHRERHAAVLADVEELPLAR